jgi:4-hydroxybenzoate polyprenyltransferase
LLQKRKAKVSSIAKSAKVFAELVIPWQGLSSYFWFFSGILSSPRDRPFFKDWTLFLVLLAIFAARSAGMFMNRCIDKKIDAKNPRTTNRALPSGRVSFIVCALFAALFLAVLLLSCSSFPLCGKLVCIWVAMLIALYSYTKRFTSLCHFVLGAIHGTLPIVGSLWTSLSVSLPSVFLGIAAFFAISGTDIIYALSDEAFDKREGLHSIPARFGSSVAIKIAALLHLGAFFFITLCMPSLLSLAVWGVFVAYGVFFWRLLLGNGNSLFSRFFLIFSGGTFSSLLVEHVWNALL